MNYETFLRVFFRIYAGTGELTCFICKDSDHLAKHCKGPGAENTQENVNTIRHSKEKIREKENKKEDVNNTFITSKIDTPIYDISPESGRKRIRLETTRTDTADNPNADSK